MKIWFKCYNQVPDAMKREQDEPSNFVLLSLSLQASDFAPVVTWQRDLIIISHHFHPLRRHFDFTSNNGVLVLIPW